MGNRWRRVVAAATAARLSRPGSAGPAKTLIAESVDIAHLTMSSPPRGQYAAANPNSIPKPCWKWRGGENEKEWIGSREMGMWQTTYLKSEGGNKLRRGWCAHKRVPSKMLFFEERDSRQSVGSEGVFKVVETRFCKNNALAFLVDGSYLLGFPVTGKTTKK